MIKKKKFYKYASSTFVAKPEYIKDNRQWIEIDATGLTLGRLASRVALMLQGKHKPWYTPNMNCGDKVVVINAEKIHTTGAKLKKNVRYHHTGYEGGIKSQTWDSIINSAHPERLLHKAVKGMLDKGPLANAQLDNLRVYSGNVNPHAAQNCQKPAEFLGIVSKS